MSDQPLKDQPTPLSDAKTTYASNFAAQVKVCESVNTRALEQRMRAAEALLAEHNTVVFDSSTQDSIANWMNKAHAHLAAAQAMDAGGEFPYVTEDRKNSHEFARVVSATSPQPRAQKEQP